MANQKSGLHEYIVEAVYLDCRAVIRRSAVVGPVPSKILAACALFLRRNHLRLVLFNTRVQSCHEKFGCARVCNVHVGGTHYAYIMFV